MVRRERPADEAAVRLVQVEAFRSTDEDPTEAVLLDGLRSCDGWLSALSWVAEIDDHIVGHVVATRGHVDDTPCVGLGPIAVEPAHQRSGIGSALMHAIIAAVDATEEPLIALLGNPDYYTRFGFVPSTELAIQPPDTSWGGFFQVRSLTAWTESIAGTFRYASPFDQL